MCSPRSHLTTRQLETVAVRNDLDQENGYMTRYLKRTIGGLAALAMITLAGLAGATSAAAAQPAAPAKPASIGAAFEFISRGPGKCADVAGASLDDNTAVWSITCQNSLSQNWLPEDVGGGWFRMRNLNSNLCLDYARTTNGTTIKQHTCGNDVAQRWQLKFSPQVPGFFSVVSGHGLCMDLDGSSPVEGARIQIWTCLNNTNQLWRQG
jgi:hypothetical protein